MSQLSPIEQFACFMFDQHRNDGYPGDVDGWVLQDKLVELGLLKAVEVTEHCGDEDSPCSCAEFGFPATCYRTTPDMLKLMSIYRSELPRKGNSV